jgi:hypothetical protein
MKAILASLGDLLKTLNRSKVVHGITTGLVLALAVLVALHSGLPAGTKIEVDVGLLVALLTRVQYQWQKVIPLLDGSTVVQTSPPATGQTPSLVSVAENPAQVLSRRTPYIPPVGLLLLIGIALGACHGVKPNQVLADVVDCAKVNLHNLEVLQNIVECAQGLTNKDPAACLDGLASDVRWSEDEIKCVAAYVAAQASTPSARQAALWLSQRRALPVNFAKPGTP